MRKSHKQITVSAPGKVIFMGDHAVVYGKPGLIAAIDKRCRIKLTIKEPSQGLGKNDQLSMIKDQEKSIIKNQISKLKEKSKESGVRKPESDEQKVEIYSKQMGQRIVTTVEKIVEKTKQARALWQAYEKTGDIKTLKKITDEPLDLAQYAVVETFAALKKQFQGDIRLEIDSQIPIGSGLGSSAALSVGIAGAITYLLTGFLDKHVINDISYTVEHRIHGMPSGVDSATSAFGGLIWYRKELPFFKLMSPVGIDIPETIARHCWFIDTGKPQESTGEMVGWVRQLKEKEPKKVEVFLEKQEQVTKDLLVALKEQHPAQFIKQIKIGEKNLEELGVVSSSVQTLIRDIEEVGGAAKICGGGGKMKATGIVLAYHPDIRKIKSVVEKYAFSAFQTPVGEEGVRIETEVRG